MYKVLLVDDEVLVRDAIRANINWNGLGFELVGDCENGKEAKEFVDTHPIDVVLTDICMPYVDGMELSKYLFHNYPDTAIIIFSGFEEFEYAKKAIQYQVAEYILKPVTAMELSNVLVELRGKLDERQKKEQTIDHLRQVYSTYKKNESMIISKALSRLAMGTQETKMCLKELEMLGVKLEAAYYRIVVVELDVYCEMFDVEETLKKESAFMAFVVENICNEIIHSYQIGRAFQTSDNRVCLLVKTNKPKETKGLARCMCEEIQRSISTHMKLSISCGMGSYVDDVSALHTSYESAINALGYRFILGEQTVLDMEDLRACLDMDIDIEQELEALPTVVKSANEKELDELFERVRKQMIDKLVARNRACFYLQQLFRIISDTLAEVGEDLELHVEQRNYMLKKIARSRTYLQAHRDVLQYAHEAMGRLSDMNHSSGHRQAILAMDYIKKNYSNCDLSLHSICAYLNISISHFSAIFKEVTGSTFMEVLINIRMEKAKELLKQTTLKNYEIADRVGISDPHYFSVSFKKMTGKTPTEYTKENRR
ncbi:response regulator [Lachnospiraceae bacterium LCP25S3_G4]